jgi:hypothetical protein
MPAESAASGDAGGDDSGSPKDKRATGVNKAYQGRYGFQRPTGKQPKFEGKCDDLKGHIYDCTDSRQSDMFMKTTREVGKYVVRNYKYGGDLRLTVENLERIEFEEPTDPPNNATRTQEQIWEKDVNKFVKRKGYHEENIKTLLGVGTMHRYDEAKGRGYISIRGPIGRW